MIYQFASINWKSRVFHLATCYRPLSLWGFLFTCIVIYIFLCIFSLKMKGNGLSLITRGNNTLDLVLTNLHKFYKPKPAEVFPPFGLSDHKTIAIYPDVRPPKSSSRCSVLRRDTHPSRKRELGRYLIQIDWSFVNSAATCEEKKRSVYYHRLHRFRPVNAREASQSPLQWCALGYQSL